ncbi:hypothetical protein [Bacillus subtilis]
MTNIDVSELKERIKEYVYANKSQKLLLRTAINHFKGEMEILHKQGEHYEEVSRYLVKVVNEAIKSKTDLD